MLVLLVVVAVVLAVVVVVLVSAPYPLQEIIYVLLHLGHPSVLLAIHSLHKISARMLHSYAASEH